MTEDKNTSTSSAGILSTPELTTETTPATETPTTHREPDYFLIAKTLRRHWRINCMAVWGFIALPFIIIVLLPLIGSLIVPMGKGVGNNIILFGKLQYTLLIIVLILFLTGITVAIIKSYRTFKVLKELTGFKCRFFSFDLPVDKQVERFLQDCGYESVSLVLSNLKQFRLPPIHPAHYDPHGVLMVDNNETDSIVGNAQNSVENTEEDKKLSFRFRFTICTIAYVVIVLMSLVFAWYLCNSEYSHITRSRDITLREMSVLTHQLQRFKEENGKYPASLLELDPKNEEAKLLTDDLRQKLYRENLPVRQSNRYTDFWQNNYYYQSNGESWKLISLVEDEKNGGIGIAADIVITSPGPEHWMELREDFAKRYPPTFSQIIHHDVFKSAVLVGVLFGSILFFLALYKGRQQEKQEKKRTKTVFAYILDLFLLVLFSMFVIFILVGGLTCGDGH